MRASLLTVFVFLGSAAGQQPVPERQLVTEISGVLVDEGGSPIERPASVIIQPCGSGEVDDEGQFRVKCGPQPDWVSQYITIIIHKEGWEAGAISTAVPPGGALPDPIHMRKKAVSSSRVSQGSSIGGSVTIGGDAYEPTLEFRIYNPNPRPVFVEDLEIHVDGVDEIGYGMAPLRAEPSNEPETGEYRLSSSVAGYFVSQAVEQQVKPIDKSDPVQLRITDNSTRGDLDHIYRLHAEVTWRDGPARKRAAIGPLLFILVSGPRNGDTANPLVSSQQEAQRALAADRDVLKRLSGTSAMRNAALERLVMEVRSFQPENVQPGITIGAIPGSTVDTARLFIAAGFDIQNSPDAPYLFYRAVLNRRWDIAQLFIDHGVNLNLKNEYDPDLKDGNLEISYGQAALASVAESGETHFASVLIDKGVNASAAFAVGAKPAVIQLALNAGGKPPQDYYCSIVLGHFPREGIFDVEKHKPEDLSAAWPERDEILTMLIERGAPLDQSDCGRSYDSVIEAAAATGQVDLLKKLLVAARGTKIASPQALGSIAEWSWENGSEYYEDVLRILLEAGADVRQLSSFYLERHLTPGVARLLAKYGWDVNYPPGEPPLVSAALRGDTALVDTLLELGAKREVAKNYWEAGFSDYLKNKRIDPVKCLVKAGANLNEEIQGEVLETDRGRVYEYRSATAFPVILAAAQADAQLVRILLDAGADVNAKSKAEFGSNTLTALQQTVVHRPISYEVLGMLLEKKPDFCEEVVGHITPLIFCAGQNDAKCVRALLAGGADPNGKGCDSDWAVPLNFKLSDEMRKILIDAGAVQPSKK